MPRLSDAEIERNRQIREIVREERARQREEQQRQAQAEKRQNAKAVRRNKYKQSPDDPILVWAWKEIMR
jgi:hypothetical protein